MSSQRTNEEEATAQKFDDKMLYYQMQLDRNREISSYKSKPPPAKSAKEKYQIPALPI